MALALKLRLLTTELRFSYLANSSKLVVDGGTLGEVLLHVFRSLPVSSN
jgi:hypothetical protein